MARDRNYVWCTYREWSFRILEGLLGLQGWRCPTIITTHDCRYDFRAFEQRDVRVLRVDPRKDLAAGHTAFDQIATIAPEAIFHYGWSWIVPPEVLALCPNVTLHPGKLPKDRGGSPLQNQIRNGETWTYANILELVDGLDEGPIYMRERISLAGEIDDVWARMTATGCHLTRKFLRALAAGTCRATPQREHEATFYRRVTAAQAELRPAEQTALQMYNVVRAHAETDPSTYVRPAYVRLGGLRLVIERATLEAPSGLDVRLLDAQEATGTDLHRLCADANEGRCVLAIMDHAGRRLFLGRPYMSLT